MATVNIPELVIFGAINRALTFIRADYQSNEDKTKTWLYKTFNGLTLERYNLYNELVAIIVTNGKEDPRFFKGDLMFNPKKESVPSFHVTLPSESPADGNTIGMGEGSVPSFYEDTLDNDDQIISTEESVVFSRSSQANYNIVIISDNPMEVVLLYHLMRAIIIASHMKFADSNLINLTLGGQDLQPYREISPQLYMRALSVGLQYSTSAIAMDTIEYFNDVTVDGVPVAE